MGCTTSSSAMSSTAELDYQANYQQVYFDSSGKLHKFNPNLNPSIADQLKFIKENDKVPMKAGDECYVVSTAWLSEWFAYVSGDGDVTFVGPIRNDHLVSLTNKEKMKMKVKLKEDFRTVNKKIWEYYFECYGGGPVIYFSVPYGLDEKLYKSHKWINTVNTFQCSTVIYPSAGPEQAGSVVVEAEKQKPIEERQVSFEEIYKEEEAEIEADIAAANVASIGGWMTNALLGRKTLSSDSIDEDRLEKDKQRREQAAAITVQRVWRLKKARMARKEFLEKHEADRQHTAAMKMQCSWRSRQAKMSVRQLRSRQNAALIITRIVRSSGAVLSYIRSLANSHPHVAHVTIREVRGAAQTGKGSGQTFVVLSGYDPSEDADERSRTQSTSKSSFNVFKGGKSNRRGSLIAASLAAPSSDVLALRCHAQSASLSPSSATLQWKKGGDLTASNIRGSSTLVLTVLHGDASAPPNTFLGQVVLTLNSYPTLYLGQTVDLELPLQSLSVPVESPLAQPLASPPTIATKITGTIHLSLSVPPLVSTMCGWVQKVSDGLLTKGAFKKRWVILEDGALSYFEDPFTLDTCKGTLKLADVIDIVEVEGGSIVLKQNKEEQTPWTLLWDAEESEYIRDMWARKLVRCLPDSIRKRNDIRRIPMLKGSKGC